jgi:hypothetical protein
MDGLPTLTVIVDDTDSSINYTGTWITDNGRLDGENDQFGGPEYNHTLHGTVVNGSSITYSFNGEPYRAECHIILAKCLHALLLVLYPRYPHYGVWYSKRRWSG